MSYLQSLQRLAMRTTKGFRAWCQTQVQIKDKESGKIGPWTTNVLQDRVCDAVEYCLANNLPIRLICAKPRQKGASTIFTALTTWLGRVFADTTAIVIGAKAENVESLWGYLTGFATLDRFDWGAPATVAQTTIRLGNGSQIRRESAEGKNPGVGWDCRIMHLTEVALWAEKGIKNARELLRSALGSIDYLPGTAIIMESTGRGPAGVFHETWQHNSCWLEDLVRDPVTNRGKYIRIFAAWWEFPGALSRIHLSEPERRALEADLTPPEERMMARYGIGIEQIAWYRHTLREKYAGDAVKMAQEHPTRWEDSFEAFTPSIFCKDGLEVLEAHCSQEAGRWAPHLLRWDERTRSTVAQPCSPDAAMWSIYELARPGDRYVMGCDFASGKDPGASGTNRDHHVVTVMRVGKFAGGRWHKPRVVARTVWPCQWDIDVLEDEIWAGSILYGGCLIVPERNQDDGVTRNLVNRGANVFVPVMEQDVSTGARKARPSAYYGFTVTGGREADRSKRMLVRRLIETIREHDLEAGSGVIVDERTLYELRVFVQDGEGRYGALPGEHDDSVMALAFCLATLDQATIYVPSPEEAGFAWSDPLLRRHYGNQPTGYGSVGGGGGAGL